MQSKKWSSLFIIILLAITLIAPAIPQAQADGYGEDSPSLGQMVDDYENDDNVAVKDDVIRNATLNCMELNYTTTPENHTVVYTPLQFREHDYHPSYDPVMTFAQISDNVRVVSTETSIGQGNVFFTVDREWIHGKYLRCRWNNNYGTGEIYLIDGDYDRSSMVDFPSNANMVYKGNGLLQTIDTVVSGEKTSDVQIDSSGGALQNVTILFRTQDSWTATAVTQYLYWLQINESPAGSDNIIDWDFDAVGTTVTMEQTGTLNDYGRLSGGDIEDYEISTGGYETNGWFTTTELLSGINGSSLVLMMNSTLNIGTLTVEFSPDNSTWTLNDWDPIIGGFESIDLRDINSTTLYLRYNFTRGGIELTPRIFQTRIISTEGPPGAGDFVCAPEFFNASSIEVITGTLNDGNLASTYFVDGDWYNVSEVTGPPGIDIRVNFTDVEEGCGCFEFFQTFTGHPHHDIEVQIWNFTSTSWITIGPIFFNETANWACIGLGHYYTHFFDGGNFYARFYHEGVGHVGHEFHVDRIDLGLVQVIECPPGAPVDDYSIIFLAIGLIFMLAIAFLYVKRK